MGRCRVIRMQKMMTSSRALNLGKTIKQVDPNREFGITLSVTL